MTDTPPIREGLEITTADAAAALNAGSACVLDVRLAEELSTARIGEPIHIPLHELPERLEDLSDDLEDRGQPEVLVLCHHGVRSLKATLMLHEVGITSARSIVGGIEAWSQTVDPEVPRYQRDGSQCTIVS